MRSESEVTCAIDQYADTVKRICLVYLKNKHDTEDIFQNVFLKYMLNTQQFQSEEHEKAWLIRITLNECKDLLKKFYRKNLSLDEIQEEIAAVEKNDQPLLKMVLTLPQHYRDVLYLYYYEGYKVAEIAQLLHKKENTIFTWMKRAKEELKIKLGGEDFE